MFKEIDKYFKNGPRMNILGSELKDYLGELRESKVFRNSKIDLVLFVPSEVLSVKVVEDREKFQGINVNKWTRFTGSVFIHSISLLPSILHSQPDVYIIGGYFDDCKISHDEETAIKLDRLYELNKLDI